MLVCVTFVAAGGWVFTKSALIEFPPHIFLAIRFCLASVILALLCWPELKQLTKVHCFRAFGTGMLLGLTLLLWVVAVAQSESIGEGAFIVSLTVVFVPLIGRLFFGDALSISLLLALVPAISGLALLSIEVTDSQTFSFSFERSHVYFLLSTIGFALHVILTNRFGQKIAAMPLATVQLAAIGLVALISAITTESWPADIHAISWFWLLCSAVIATSLRFALQTKALTYLNPSNATMIFMLEPVWVAILGALFLTERMTENQILGCALIFSALVVYRAPAFVAFWRRKSEII
ncbi:MAG: drug/metabolite transporter (DMT)-like permease [Oleiphilaceae bacterium]|jgi:drug/metabolite transporter (DMT)-like permease